MESIIAIYGPANVGKTHTLCKLIELIAHEQNIAVEISGDTKQTFVINGKTVCICKFVIITQQHVIAFLKAVIVPAG